MFEQTSYSGTHVFGVKERRSHRVHNLVRRANTTIQIGSNDPLADCIGEGRALGKTLGGSPGLPFKGFIGNDPVHNIPSLKRSRIVLVRRVDDLAGSAWSRTFGQALNTAQKSRRSNRRLSLTETR